MIEMPEDVIFRILLWLPVASLVRFKSVCRDWYALIQSSHFVYRHSTKEEKENKKSGNDFRLIALYDYDYMRYESDLQKFSLVSPHNSVPLDFPTIHDPYHINRVVMVASSNGIVCLQQDRRVCLWNPATKQSINLPPLPILPLWCSLGFAFDVKTNIFKVLCLDNKDDNIVPYLYNPISDSWTIIHTSLILPLLIVHRVKALYRNRIYCCLTLGTRETPNEKAAILSFDFTDEVFGTIPIPSMLDSDSNSNSRRLTALFILRNNLACSILVVDGGSQCVCIEICMLNDYDDGDSWTKLYLIEPFQVDFDSMWCYPKHALSTDEDFLLFQRESDSQLCLYNFVTRQVTTLPLQVTSYIDEVLVYSESLISIKRGGGATDGINSEDPSGRILIKESLTKNNVWGDNCITKVILYHILLWLPVVSLLRFKSVCKSWWSLIESSDFVAKHVQHRQNANGDINFILHHSHGESLFKDPSRSSRNTSFTCLLSAEKFELLDLPYNDAWLSSTIVSSSDGIICLTDADEKNVLLWNPTMKQLRAIPMEWDHWEDHQDFQFGFGCDVNRQDYKLVRLRFGFHPDDDSCSELFQIYNLSTDCWRNIDDTILRTVARIDSGLQAPYRNEIYCWSALVDYTKDLYGILSFDFSTEVFNIIPLPDGISSDLDIRLTVLREKIAYISKDTHYSLEVDNWHCEIWIMNEYGLKESWTKLYTLESFSNDWHVQLGYSTKNRDYIVLQKDGQLYTCDLVTQEIEIFPFGIQVSRYDGVLLYKESLVPVRRRLCKQF